MANLGWALDYRKFRRYLTEKYHVSRAFYFIGKVEFYESLYNSLESKGYELVFKEVQRIPGGGFKGNCDAELVLETMKRLAEYDKAIIVSSDGDFSCLVEHLMEIGKLERVLAPCRYGCSKFLQRSAKERIDYIDNLRGKLEYKKEGGTP